MEDFITNNISIINKNNNLIIKVGKKNNGTFINKVSHKVVEVFMSNIYQKFPHIKKFKVNTNKKIYKNKNSLTIVDNRNYDNYTYRIINSEIIKNINQYDLHLSVVKKEDQDECVTSLYEYHDIEKIEKYIIDINNLFNVIITNTTNNRDSWFSIVIEIKKPNSSKKLYNKILSVINML